MSEEMLLTNADRLGVRDQFVIKKAQTFLRILNSKPFGKTITDAAKVIMCLDLAAINVGITFDRNFALKLTGLKRNTYQNSINNLEKMLNLDKPLTVKDLCVQFDCTQARELAENILTKYQEHDSKVKDINHPQYVAVAVYTSCKIKKIKVEQSRFKAISRIKQAQWNDLKDEFEKFSAAMGLTAIKQDNHIEMSQPEQSNQGDNTELQSDQKKTKDEVETEDYEVWKERMLKEATIQILQNEIMS